jgi:hypothetical protein
MNFISVIAKNHKIVHYGLIFSWIINIQKLKSWANIESLPMIADSRQFNYDNASVNFEVNRISSKEITALIPAPKDLTTEIYVEFNEDFLKIKDKIWDEKVAISLKIFGIFANTQQSERLIPCKQKLIMAQTLSINLKPLEINEFKFM